MVNCMFINYVLINHVFIADTACSWSELTRKLELWVEIHELSEQGEYVPVEVSPKPEVPSGGVFQLRQVSAPLMRLSYRPHYVSCLSICLSRMGF